MFLKRSKTLIALILAVACAAVSAGWCVEEAIYPDSPNDVVIQVKTTPSTDDEALKLSCVPEFTLYGDGRVIYLGRDKKQNQKLYETSFGPDYIYYLLQYIDCQGFEDFNENYLNLTVKNLETTTITVNWRKYSKKVTVYGLELASYQGMIPDGLGNIYRKLSNFEVEEKKVFQPDQITLLVREYKKKLPDKAGVENWGIQEIDLTKYASKDELLGSGYREINVDGKLMEKVLNKIGGKTLYENRAGFYKHFFRDKKKIFKVAYRPHLPHE